MNMHYQRRDVKVLLRRDEGHGERRGDSLTLGYAHEVGVRRGGGEMGEKNRMRKHHDHMRSNDSSSSSENGHDDTEQKKKKSKPDSELSATDRRILQNRAAQRAFRQRKERYVRDLEEKVANLLSQLRVYERQQQSHPPSHKWENSKPADNAVNQQLRDLQLEVDRLRIESQELRTREQRLKDIIATQDQRPHPPPPLPSTTLPPPVSTKPASGDSNHDAGYTKPPTQSTQSPPTPLSSTSSGYPSSYSSESTWRSSEWTPRTPQGLYPPFYPHDAAKPSYPLYYPSSYPQDNRTLPHPSPPTNYPAPPEFGDFKRFPKPTDLSAYVTTNQVGKQKTEAEGFDGYAGRYQGYGYGHRYHAHGYYGYGPVSNMQGGQGVMGVP